MSKGSRVPRKATGSISQHEHWDMGLAKKVSEGILAPGDRLTPASLTSPVAVRVGDVLRIRVTAQSFIAFSEDDTALGAATINDAYADSPVLELNSAGVYLIAVPPPAQNREGTSAANRTKQMYVKMSSAPARAERICG